METEDIYEIAIRIQNARKLLTEGETERAERVLLNIENDLRRIITLLEKNKNG